MRLQEVNPNTLRGSLGKNLIENKFWAFTELSKIKNQFDTIYVLGSWYGNAGLMLSMDPRFEFEKIINVEIDRPMLAVSQKLAKLSNERRIEPMLKDANSLDYRQLGPDGLVVNFSCTNIQGSNWFDNIPDGTMVLISGRNNDPGAVNQFDSLEEFTDTYLISKSLFVGTKEFTDPETDYDSYLVIGIK